MARELVRRWRQEWVVQLFPVEVFAGLRTGLYQWVRSTGACHPMYEIKHRHGKRFRSSRVCFLLCIFLWAPVAGAQEDAGGLCGDANGDLGIDLGDAIYILTWLFRGGEDPRCGELACIDVNSDSGSDLSDAITLLEWLFSGGDEPDCNAPRPPVYELGYVSLSFSGSPGSRGEIPIDVFYPAAEGGEAASPAAGRFPLVVFGHGYGMQTLDYAYLWEALVPAGYIFAISDRLSDATFLNLEDYSLDLRFVLSRIRQEGEAGDSPLRGHVGDAAALMGHSAGAGASVLAAADALARNEPGLQTILLLAPLGSLLPPVAGVRQPVRSADEVDVPVLVIEGEKDCTTPPDLHSRPVFQSLPREGFSYLVNLSLGDHCGFADKDGPTTLSCGLAEIGLCNPLFPFFNIQGETLGSVEQTRIVSALVKPWLDRHLKESAGEGDPFEEALSSEDVTWHRR